MDLGIKNKIFIVTGGGKGIGEAIVQTLANEEAIPVIVGRKSSASEALNESLQQQGKSSWCIHKELGTADSCKEVVAEVISKYGQIDGLVNNAGVNDGVGLEKGNPEMFLESLQKNLYHYYYMAHYCLPYLIKSKGSIVNISSKTAITGQGHTSGYAASKGAQLALTREWAVELLSHGIRVNAIVPAEVMTPLYENWLSKFKNPKQKLEEITKNIPLGQRMTTKEEIASMTVYLLSKQASHITGQQLYVDGGYVHLDRALAGNDLKD